MSNRLELTLLPGFDGTGELFGPLQAALGSKLLSKAVRYDAERVLDDYVDSVASVLPKENAVLIAESFSGPVALSLLDRYPDRIKCAVLCATFAVSPCRSLTRAARFLPTFMFAPTPIQRRLLRDFCLNGESDDALVDQANAVIHSVSAATIQNRLQVLSGVDMTSLLPQIATPVLYLRAMQDRIVNSRLSRKLTQELPRVTVQEIEGPHLLLQSRPTQCAAAISRFVSDLRANVQD
jgi:pimeloyl-ACP methyl ester carboxylesterase